MTRKLRVFLVDRRLSTYEMNFTRLRKAGYEVQRYAAPLGTVKAVFRAHPDVLILDWRLSPLGVEKVLGILKGRKLPFKPQILLLGDPEDSQKLEQRVKCLGVEGFVLRDQTGEALVRAVERLTRERPLLHPLPSSSPRRRPEDRLEEHDLPGYWGESELGGL